MRHCLAIHKEEKVRDDSFIELNGKREIALIKVVSIHDI